MLPRALAFDIPFRSGWMIRVGLNGTALDVYTKTHIDDAMCRRDANESVETKSVTRPSSFWSSQRIEPMRDSRRRSLAAEIPNRGLGRRATTDHVTQLALDLIDARRVTLLGTSEHFVDELPNEGRVVVVRWICSHWTSTPRNTRARGGQPIVAPRSGRRHVARPREVAYTSWSSGAVPSMPNVVIFSPRGHSLSPPRHRHHRSPLGDLFRDISLTVISKAKFHPMPAAP